MDHPIISVMLRYALLVLLLTTRTPLAQSNGAPAKTENNAELTEIYNEDQRVRSPQPLSAEERRRITRTDADRLTIVKMMIAQDRLATTLDYRHAAFIVQHSLVSSDYLVAHTLAMICAGDGDKTCAWLSAASLDRYLQSISQPQIYGTQFIGMDHSSATQNPYSDSVITDALRKKLGVPTLVEQKKELDDINRANHKP